MDKLKKAKDLLRSARFLFDNDDIFGVAGLSYQAVEAGIAHLTTITNGVDQSSHTKRRQRAEEILDLSKNSLKKLWNARNIDFYGNEKIGQVAKELGKEEIEESLKESEEIIDKIEKHIEEMKEEN